MNWAVLYLVCFFVGIALSLLSFAGASLHFPHLHLHLPHAHSGVSHPPGGRAAVGSHMPVVNFGTLTAFLTWFGGAGFLLTRFSTMVVGLILIAATVAGLAGAAVIFWFLVKFLLTHDRELDPADYERVGVLARVSSQIAAGGTGEIIFSLGGTRQTCGARADDSRKLPRGAQVIITRYEHGLAYVRPWDEMLNENSIKGAADTPRRGEGL